MTPLETIARARLAGRASLTEEDAKTLVAAFGVTVPRSCVLPPGLGSDSGEIEASAGRMKPPFALKVMSAAILHKSDVGGVRLGLFNANEVRRAIDEMLGRPAIANAVLDGFVLEEMVAPGHELVIGGTVHPQFGPVLMLGLGGIFVETLDDVTFRICPLTRVDAGEMIDELRGAPILKGARGRPAADLDSIVDVLMKIGGAQGLMCELAGDIAELDLNPLIVDATRAVAVDARIVLSQRSGHG